MGDFTPPAIREEDLAELARLGFNSVRVPFNHTLLEDDAAPFVYKDEGWAVLDRLLEWCEAHRVYVVLDLHAAPGGQSPFYMADPDSTKLWDSSRNQDRTVALWRAIAERYRDREIIVWTWKKVPNNSAHLVGVTADLPHWKKLIKWVESDWNARPTVAEARAGMDQFFEAARLENCDVNAERVSALRVR